MVFRIVSCMAGLLLCLCLIGAEPGHCAEQTLPSIAIISCDDQLAGGTGAQRQYTIPLPMADRIAEVLQNSKRFRVLDRGMLQRVVNERLSNEEPQGFFAKLGDAMERAVSRGSMIGDRVLSSAQGGKAPLVHALQNIGNDSQADYLVFGSIETMQASQTTVAVGNVTLPVSKQALNLRIRMRVVDVKTTELVGMINASETVESWSGDGGSDAAGEMMDAVCKKLAGRIIDVIYPAKLAGTGTLVVTRGANDGVEEGAVFEILRAGEAVVEEGVGSIGTIKKRIGTVRAVDVQERLSVVEPVEGEGFMAGDLAFRKDEGRTARAAGQPAAYAGKKLASPNGSNRFAIAVGKVTFLGGSPAVQQNVATRIVGDLSARLTASNRFILADRSSLDQSVQEATFDETVHNGDMAARMQQLQGVDYILTVEMRQLGVTVKTEAVPYLNETITSGQQHLEAVLRLLDTHSGTVVLAEKVYSAEDLHEDSSISRFVDSFCGDAVARVINRLFPVKVMHASGKACYINRGLDGGIASGQKFEVFRPGEEMKDPDTGLTFGAAEVSVGHIRCAGVEASRSRCEQVDGEPLQVGDIARVVKQKGAGQSKQSQPVKTQAAPAQPQW